MCWWTVVRNCKRNKKQCGFFQERAWAKSQGKSYSAQVATGKYKSGSLEPASANRRQHPHSSTHRPHHHHHHRHNHYHHGSDFFKHNQHNILHRLPGQNKILAKSPLINILIRLLIATPSSCIHHYHHHILLRANINLETC